MPHAYCDLLLQVHGAVAVSTLAAFYHYSDRTEGFISSLNGTSTALLGLRRKITANLREQLEPMFENPGSVPSPILGPDGNSIDDGTYVEHAVNPVRSEQFQEAVRGFVDARVESLTDYQTLAAARQGWCHCCLGLSRVIIGLFAWSLISLALLALDKNGKLNLPDWAMITISLLTGILVTIAFVIIFLRLHYYSTITRMRLKHGEF